MKRFLFLLPVLLITFGAANAQTPAVIQNPVPEMDAAVKLLAEEFDKKLVELKVQYIAVTQVIYNDFVSPLSNYWINQLTEELVNMPGRTYTVLSGGPSGAEYTISGEIVEVANIIRVYTRLVRTSDRAIEASLHSDLERNQYLIDMLFSSNSSSGGSSGIPRDAWEPDSYDNPVHYEIGDNENMPVMNRTIHDGSDQDFFLLIPAEDGWLVMETTGSTDTYFEFFDGETGALLREDDDGGQGYNARIRYSVQAGHRYILKVRGYSSSSVGPYGFRAYLQTQARLQRDEYEPDDDPADANWIEIGETQTHNFHHADDVDWVKFQVTEPGRYIIRTRGTVSNRLDTYIELFDSNLNSIAENDDGGEYRDSRLSLRLDTGVYYLKVWCLDDEPDQPYTIIITRE